jgi:hypothetical protein
MGPDVGHSRADAAARELCRSVRVCGAPLKTTHMEGFGGVCTTIWIPPHPQPRLLLLPFRLARRRVWGPVRHLATRPEATAAAPAARRPSRPSSTASRPTKAAEWKFARPCRAT